MTPVDWTLLAAVAVLVGLTALLAAVETVLTRLGLVRALALDEEERRGAGALLWLVEHPARGLNVVLLLTITARITAAVVLTVLVVRWGLVWTAVAAVVLVVASFVLAEVAPRTYTLRHLERIGLLVARPVAATARLLQPLARALATVGGRVSGTSASGPFSSDEELRRLLAVDDEHAVEIEDDERAMIRSIFELDETTCREIMVPRPDMVTVGVDDPLHEVVRTSVERGFSRIPVSEGARDRIVGVVYAKDLLERLHAALHAGGGDELDTEGWHDLVREATFVPESRRADDLLRDLQHQQVHLAIVVDEYGDVVGLVTIEDILEEIVGEIVDEYDREAPPVVRLDDRRLRVNARVTVHDLNELLDTDLPEDEGWDTVGGLMLGTLGRVPRPGESVTVDGVTLVAERVQGRRVSEVLVTYGGDEREPEPASGGER
jgi:CBS domain containing-hemolysin-like protein